MDRLDVGRSLTGVAGMENAQANLNISDVIEVIQTTDPEFGVDTMFPAGSMEDSRKKSAYVKILEQPAPKALRFRYECEGRSAGSIPGVNSTPENKTFPTIQIVGYKGPAVVVVSCVTKDFPHRPHPHNLVGKEGCKKGICTMRINSETMTVTFSNLGIQCVKKKDIEEALKVREEIRVDPFRTGFSHRNQPSGIDLNTVRLCFQVFLEDAEREKFTLPLAPVVSDPIYDKKAMSDLVICKLGDCSCTVAGGKEIILLCEKVAKEDIQIYFFEMKDGKEVWHGFGDFQPANVHKQYAITFRTPSYKTLQVDAPVTVFIQLRRPSDGAASEALPFQYLPIDSELKRKRQKYTSETNHPHNVGPLGEGMNMPPQGPSLQMQQLQPLPPVKIERPDASYGQPYRFQSPYPSPQPPTPSPQSRGTPSPSYVSPYHAGGMMEGTLTYSVAGPGGTGGGQVIQRMPEPSSGGWGVPLPEYSSIRPQFVANNMMGPGSGNVMTVNSDFVLGIAGPNVLPGGTNMAPNIYVNAGNPNMPGTSAGPGNIVSVNAFPPGTSVMKDTPTNSCIMDLDSQQPYNLDSSDLAGLDMMLNQNLSENLSSNLTLSENRTHQQQQSSENMSDSLLSLKKEISNLNDLYKGGVGDGDRH